ncbi:MAG TPA: DNA mismatch repair endonuclease MutL [Candidatus Babeliales bacterium]|nr:DNA mismatch repair endonuclease MutL [Candidatus Babeliales bacterium]
MNRIHQLPPHEAHKIAAGEVIDKPANVVKELVENAIDAGATQITVYIEDGGKQLIRVIDNGCGMSYEDARICIAQYATSKISSINDLTHISTFGFRGEALASISAVSKTMLITKEDDAVQGISLTIENSAIIQEALVSCNTGTDITISDLFYNIPARKKFLKKRDTEWRAILQLMHAICLSYTTVSFKLFHDGTQVLHCPRTETVLDRCTQIWDHTVSQHLVTLPNENNKTNTISISGVISNHHYYRYDRSNMFFFVNKRWVKNYNLGRALLKGYLNAIPPQRAPLTALFIEVDPTELDVNIHPRKEEVQFLHPHSVETVLQSSVKQTLEKNLTRNITQPTISTNSLTPKTSYFDQAPYQSYEPYQSSFTSSALISDKPALPSFDFNAPVFDAPASPTQPLFEEYNDIQQPLYTTTPTPAASIVAEQNDAFLTSEKQTAYTLIGQYNKTYILIEQEDGLFLVDQHAAHERVLYELFAKRFNEIATISLLFPQIVTLSDHDIALITPYLELFTHNGIIVEPFGPNQLIIQSTPVHLKNSDCDALIKEIISWIHEEQDVTTSDFFETAHKKLRAQMACKAAVKAGDAMTTEQMQTLLNDLGKTDNRFTCPHGRPTGWLLSLHDIEKKFKRKK